MNHKEYIFLIAYRGNQTSKQMIPMMNYRFPEMMLDLDINRITKIWGPVDNIIALVPHDQEQYVKQIQDHHGIEVQLKYDTGFGDLLTDNFNVDTWEV